jgi:chaperone required for assembly of F1-ATPase
MSDAEKEGNGDGKARAKILGKEPLRAPLAKRFYKRVTVEARDGGSVILLDGRTIKTPRKRKLSLPSAALARAVAAEWAAQGPRIDPDTMPLTRIANTAIDAVADHMTAVADDIVAFAGNDLLCYRAAEPDGLAERQRASWDPVLAWARGELGAGFVEAEGVMPIEQPAEALTSIWNALDGLDPFRLTSLHIMTTLTGSALLALAHVRGRLTLEEAWAGAHVDEDWQIEHWGEDGEAAARRRHRLGQFEAASRLLTLLAGPR